MKSKKISFASVFPGFEVSYSEYYYHYHVYISDLLVASIERRLFGKKYIKKLTLNSTALRVYSGLRSITEDNKHRLV